MKMTLHKILSELKTLDKRIEKAIMSMDPISVMRGSKIVNSTLTEDEFTKEAISSVDSVEGLINRKFILRSALLNANCSVKVTISGKEYTIYQAIEMKEIMNFKKKELDKLSYSLREANNLHQRIVDRNDSDLEKQIQFFCQSAKEDAKPDIVAKLTEQMNTLNGVKLLDPINISEKIKSLSDGIENFMIEVDSALSEINSITTVEVED